MATISRIGCTCFLFVNKPVEGLDVLLGLPPELRDVHFLRVRCGSYAHAPADTSEEVLFKLAEADSRFYFDAYWRDAVMALGTNSSARRLIDLLVSGALNSRSLSSDRDLVRQLGGVLERYQDLRSHVYRLLKDGAGSASRCLPRQSRKARMKKVCWCS